MTGIVALGSGYKQPVTAVVSISNQTVLAIDSGTVNAIYSVNNDKSVISSQAILENWLTGPGALVGNYQVLVTKASGPTVDGDAIGSWLSLSTSRAWFLTNSAANNSTKTAVLTVSIRDVATSTVQDSASVTLRATSNSN